MEEVVINPRRTPLKGEPSFTNISDQKLREYKDCIQDMIFAYDYDKEIKEVLRKMYKQVSNHLVDRIDYDNLMTQRVSTEDVTMSNTVVKKSFLTSEKVTLVKKNFQKPKKMTVVKKYLTN